MNDSKPQEGPVTAALFDTALLSVWKVFERFREYGGNARFAEMFSDPELLLKYLQMASEEPETNGDASVEAIWDWAESKDQDRGGAVILLVIDAIIAYATQAMRAEASGDLAAGWKYVGEARYWEGILNGIRMRKLLHPDGMEAIVEIEKAAVLMSKSRHTETAALKNDVIEYYRNNIDPTWTAAKAAEHILEKRIVPLTFRTIQGYISAEKKRMSRK